MTAYIICIIVSGIFAFFSEQSFNKEKEKSGKFYLLISFLIPLLVASVRTMLIGRDVTVYVTETLNISLAASNIFDFIQTSEIELGFGLLVYFSSFFKDLNFTLFFIELALVIPLYIYMYRNRKEKSILLMMLVFLLTTFVTSLNIMRQFIAISYVLLANDYFKKNEIKKFILCWIIAISFHSSAFVAIFIFMACSFSIKSDIIKTRKILLLVLSIAFLSLTLELVLKMLPSYSYFLDRDVLQSGVDIINSLIKKGLWVFLIILSFNAYRNKNEFYPKVLAFSLILVIFDILLYFAGFSISAVGRVGYYFLYVSYYEFIPVLGRSYRQRKMVSFAIMGILVVFWFMMTTGDPESWTYPYKSDILEFLN